MRKPKKFRFGIDLEKHELAYFKLVARERKVTINKAIMDTVLFHINKKYGKDFYNTCS